MRWGAIAALCRFGVPETPGRPRIVRRGLAAPHNPSQHFRTVTRKSSESPGVSGPFKVAARAPSPGYRAECPRHSESPIWPASTRRSRLGPVRHIRVRNDPARPRPAGRCPAGAQGERHANGACTWSMLRSDLAPQLAARGTHSTTGEQYHTGAAAQVRAGQRLERLPNLVVASTSRALARVPRLGAYSTSGQVRSGQVYYSAKI